MHSYKNDRKSGDWCDSSGFRLILTLASKQLKVDQKIPYKSFYIAMCSNFILEIDQKAINFGCVCARLDVLYIFFRYRRAVDLSFQFIS